MVTATASAIDAISAAAARGFSAHCGLALPTGSYENRSRETRDPSFRGEAPAGIMGPTDLLLCRRVSYRNQRL